MPINQNQLPTASESAVRPDLASWLDIWRREFVFFQMDPERVLTFISDSVQDVLGLKPTDMLGHNACEYFCSEHPLESLLEELADQRSIPSDLQPRLCVATRTNGELAYLGIREHIQHDAEGVIVSRSGMAYDMTEHVAAELSLRESEQKYRRLVEGLSGDNVIFTRSPAGEFTYVSPSVESVLGFTAEQVEGINWRDFVGEQFVGRDDAELSNAWVSEGLHQQKFVIEISHADGSTRLMEVQQHPVFSPDGEYISMEGIGKDITESTRTSQELQRLKDELEQRVTERTAELQLKNTLLHESEARYRHVVEDQTEFVIRWLPNGKYTFVNGAYCRYFATSSEALIGENFMPTVFAEDRPRFEQLVASLTAEHPIGTIEHRVIRSDESIGWTSWTIRALFGNDGQVEEYQSVGRDITDLKIAADTIREKEVHLAHVSRLATMGEMVAGIAHEVHQPLHAAKTFAEAARRNLEGGLPNSMATAIDCTKEISEAISRTAKIIRHIRAFTTSKPVELEMLDINCVVQEAAEIIAFETRSAQVKIRYDLEKGIPLVQGARVQLEQACVNLLMNAYEAMAGNSQGTRQVWVRTYSEKNQVMISFCDTGCGIDVADKDKVFDAFFTTKSQGMGMGLSLCKSIAEFHAGRLWAESNADVGMKFILALPQSAASKRSPMQRVQHHD